MQVKIKKFIKSFLEKNLQAYLVVNPTNISYLTGFPSSDSWLLVTKSRSYYMTDARYADEVKKSLPRDFSVVCHKKGLPAEFLALVAKKRLKKIGFDQRHISYAQYGQIAKLPVGGYALLGCDGLVEKNRLIKSVDEIKKIKAALVVHKKSLQYLKRIIKPGMTEKDILMRFGAFVGRQNASFSFDPIIASGENSSYPHALVQNRKLRRKDMVLIDSGIALNGYKSDLTRMFFLGKITDKIYRCFKHVKEAQQMAINHISEGVSVASLDELARKYLKKHGLEKFFTHALGHGIGLDVHEAPSLSQKSSVVLQAGMVVTVEPGVYFPGEFGIRLEEMVLVKKQGCEVLSDNIN